MHLTPLKINILLSACIGVPKKCDTFGQIRKLYVLQNEPLLDMRRIIESKHELYMPPASNKCCSVSGLHIITYQV